ncbi:MAG: twin-arginine translocase TatA/TatE family subunit [Candidatus Omnitrophica bacterium]|nr:twin-arginine translocase TatA/TatE family subunit [Candidatus Omnitrophota bacterium]
MRILGMGMPEILLILFICALIFGANKLPEIAHSIGRSIKELKKGFKEIDTDEGKAEDNLKQ